MTNFHSLGEPILRDEILETTPPSTDYEYIATQIMSSLIQNETMSRMVHQTNTRQMIAKLACDLADALIAEIEIRKGGH